MTDMTGPAHYRASIRLTEGRFGAHHYINGNGADPVTGNALATEALVHAVNAQTAILVTIAEILDHMAGDGAHRDLTNWRQVIRMSIFCGEFKKLNSPLCEEHDRDMREEHGGSLPRFAPADALGLAAFHRETMPHMFRLSWEPHKGDRPVPATAEEIRAWERQG